MAENRKQNMTENVSEIAGNINQGDTSHLTAWLADVIAEGTEPEETERAAELLEKLADYKPPAKIEENAIHVNAMNGMEKQNYNIHNVLNSGVGDKAQKEAVGREQEQPVAKVSLKARLAEKRRLFPHRVKAMKYRKI